MSSQGRATLKPMSEQPHLDHFSLVLAEGVNSGEFDAWFRPTEVDQGRTEGQRAFFMLLAEVVREEHDPAREWTSFCQQLWTWTDAAFGITPQEES